MDKHCCKAKDIFPRHMTRKAGKYVILRTTQNGFEFYQPRRYSRLMMKMVRSQLTWWREWDPMLKFQQLSGYVISVILQIKYNSIYRATLRPSKWVRMHLHGTFLLGCIRSALDHQLTYIFAGLSKLLPALREFCPSTPSSPSKRHLMSSILRKKALKTNKTKPALILLNNIQ